MCRGQGFRSSGLEEGTGIRSNWDLEMTVMIWVRGEKETGMNLAPSRPIFYGLSLPVLGLL